MPTHGLPDGGARVIRAANAGTAEGVARRILVPMPLSQTDEDGYLLYIFSLIGMGGRRCVEICAGDGMECNTANLLVNHNWRGLLVDGNPANTAASTGFYAAMPTTFLTPPTSLTAWVTVENVNAMLTDAGWTGEIDLLSLDIDGIDYWLWKALDAVSPRVVVLEYQGPWGGDKARSVPYDPAFRAVPEDYYMGASLPAFVKAGNAKGYRLVGCNGNGFNAFFVKRGVGEDVLPEVPASACVGEFADPERQIAWEQKHWRKHPWVEV